MYLSIDRRPMGQVCVYGLQRCGSGTAYVSAGRRVGSNTTRAHHAFIDVGKIWLSDGFGATQQLVLILQGRF